jgi:hypothetical protein
VTSIGAKYNKTGPQVALKWQVAHLGLLSPASSRTGPSPALCRCHSWQNALFSCQHTGMRPGAVSVERHRGVWSAWVMTGCVRMCACARVRVRSRTQVQMGIPVIPKSSNPEHLAQNIDLFSWTLSDEDMAGHCPTPICVGRDVLRLCALGDCALCLTHVARAGLPPSETQYTVLDSSGLSFFDCGSAVFRVQTCRLRRRSRPGWPPHFGRL